MHYFDTVKQLTANSKIIPQAIPTASCNAAIHLYNKNIGKKNIKILSLIIHTIFLNHTRIFLKHYAIMFIKNYIKTKTNFLKK